jgi:hypothetical protein
VVNYVLILIIELYFTVFVHSKFARNSPEQNTRVGQH